MRKNFERVGLISLPSFPGQCTAGRFGQCCGPARGECTHLMRGGGSLAAALLSWLESEYLIGKSEMRMPLEFEEIEIVEM